MYLKKLTLKSRLFKIYREDTNYSSLRTIAFWELRYLGNLLRECMSILQYLIIRWTRILNLRWINYIFYMWAGVYFKFLTNFRSGFEKNSDSLPMIPVFAYGQILLNWHTFPLMGDIWFLSSSCLNPQEESKVKKKKNWHVFNLSNTNWIQYCKTMCFLVLNSNLIRVI